MHEPSAFMLLSAPLVSSGHIWTSASALPSFRAVMFILGCIPLCFRVVLTYINTVQKPPDSCASKLPAAV